MARPCGQDLAVRLTGRRGRVLEPARQGDVPIRPVFPGSREGYGVLGLMWGWGRVTVGVKVGIADLADLASLRMNV